MSGGSFDRLFRGGALHRDVLKYPSLRPHALINLGRQTDREDDLVGKIGRAKSQAGQLSKLGRAGSGLDARLGASRRFGFRDGARPASGFGNDNRQRVIVKIHFFGHGGGGAAALRAHGRYIDREAAGRTPEPTQEARAKEHAVYLSGGETATRGRFYDWVEDGVDGRARMQVWADEDKRHFRLIIAPENGAALGDLQSYVRETMSRAEAALGTRLEWVAIDHWDTDNPHTHVVLRGRRGDERPLVLPRDFVKQGWRSIARDVASERLGPRTPADERRALEREARAHRPTRLDNVLAARLDHRGELALSNLRAEGRPDLENALKTRARELMRLGVASEIRRNVLSFHPDWRDRLRAMEMHLDIRKDLMRRQTDAPSLPAKLGKGKGLEL